MGCFLPAFNPDVWPPSNPSRRGTVATGSARGLKTWLFTVSGRLWHNGLCFNAFHSGRLAALKPSPAGYGCHWLQALAQWAVFYRLSIRTFGRPQTLPGGVRLPLALLGASKLGPLAAGFGTMGCFLPAFNPDVWPPSNPSRRALLGASKLGFSPFGQALAHWFGRPQTLPGRVRLHPAATASAGASTGTVRLPLALLGASKLGFSPFPAGSRTMGCVLTAFNPDVWPPSNPPRQGTAATGCRLWHNGLFFTGFQSTGRTFGRPQTLPGGIRLPLALLGASKLGFSPFPAGSGTMGCILTAFNPDVWPPSNPPRRGTVATGSARGLKTWLFTVSGRLWHNGLCFNAFHSGRLAALKPSPAGYGCHWLQALAQWAVFYRLSIRTFGRPQTLPGGVRLPLALLGASKLGFSPFGQALAHWAVF